MRITRSSRAVRLAAAVALAVGLAGCTSDEPDTDESAPPVVQLGAPGETNTTLTPEEAEGVAGPTHTDEDVAFVQGMIPHHQQALEMVALVAQRASDGDLAVLGERIEVSQVAEIARLEDWLTARGESVGGMHADHGSGEHQMQGMLTPPEFRQLARANGPRFDRLFLRYMIRHHEGAVVMVESLLTQGFGGQESEVFQLAGDIGMDQQVEIAAMKRMLARLDG